MKLYQVLSKDYEHISYHITEEEAENASKYLTGSKVKTVSMSKYWMVFTKKSYRKEPSLYLGVFDSFTNAQRVACGVVANNEYLWDDVIIKMVYNGGSIEYVVRKEKDYRREEEFCKRCVETGDVQLAKRGFELHECHIYVNKEDSTPKFKSEYEKFNNAKDAYNFLSKHLKYATAEKTFNVEWKSCHGGVGRKKRELSEWHWKKELGERIEYPTVERIKEKVKEMYEKEKKPYEVDKTTYIIAVNEEGRILYAIEEDCHPDCIGMDKIRKLCSEGCHEERFTGEAIWVVYVSEDGEKTDRMKENDLYNEYFKSIEDAVKFAQSCDGKYEGDYMVSVHAFTPSRNQAYASFRSLWIYDKYSTNYYYNRYKSIGNTPEEKRQYDKEHLLECLNEQIKDWY